MLLLNFVLIYKINSMIGKSRFAKQASASWW